MTVGDIELRSSLQFSIKLFKICLPFNPAAFKGSGGIVVARAGGRAGGRADKPR